MTQIKVGGKLYKIIYSNQTNDKVFSEEDSADGYIAYQLSEIHIRDTNSKDSMQETTVHEVLHALLDNIGVSSEETQVNLDSTINLLAPRLHAFVVDNPDFFSKLILNKISNDC